MGTLASPSTAPKAASENTHESKSHMVWNRGKKKFEPKIVLRRRIIFVEKTILFKFVSLYSSSYSGIIDSPWYYFITVHPTVSFGCFVLKKIMKGRYKHLYILTKIRVIRNLCYFYFPSINYARNYRLSFHMFKYLS